MDSILLLKNKLFYKSSVFSFSSVKRKFKESNKPLIYKQTNKIPTENETSYDINDITEKKEEVPYFERKFQLHNSNIDILKIYKQVSKKEI